jgi:hypothetical protein
MKTGTKSPKEFKGLTTDIELDDCVDNLQKTSEDFLINKDIAKDVVETYKYFINYIDDKCATSGCMCDLVTPECSQWVRDELHTLETSLRLATNPKHPTPNTTGADMFINIDSEKLSHIQGAPPTKGTTYYQISTKLCNSVIEWVDNKPPSHSVTKHPRFDICKNCYNKKSRQK